MYTRIFIQNFRSLSRLELTGLKRLNVLVGRNNGGKTSVLEAILLLCGASSPITPTKLGQLRGQRIVTPADADAVWRSLFHQLDPETPIQVSGAVNAGGERRVQVEAIGVTEYADEPDGSSPVGVAQAADAPAVGGLRLRYHSPAHPDGLITTATFDPRSGQVVAPGVQRGDFVRGTLLSARAFVNLARDADQFSYLVKVRREGEVIAAMKLLDDRLNRLVVVSESSGATVYADLGGPALYPLSVSGEGMLRLFSIVVGLTATRGGVLLVDEIDNGLHYTALQRLWPLLADLCARQDVQLIATTHNEEVVRYGVEAFAGRPDELALFRVDRTPAGPRAVPYTGEMLEAVAESGWEVRG